MRITFDLWIQSEAEQLKIAEKIPKKSQIAITQNEIYSPQPKGYVLFKNVYLHVMTRIKVY